MGKFCSLSQCHRMLQGYLKVAMTTNVTNPTGLRLGCEVLREETQATILGRGVDFGQVDGLWLGGRGKGAS